MQLPALFRLAFASAPSLKLLTSLHNATRRSVLQKVQGRALNRAPFACKHRVSGSLSLPSRGSFHLSLTVLYAIGHQPSLGLGGGPPGFPQDFSCLAVLWYCPLTLNFPYRTVTFFGPAFLRCSGRSWCSLRQPATPSVRRQAVWPDPSSLATTEGIEFSFFSSRYLDVSVPGVPSCMTIFFIIRC